MKKFYQNFSLFSILAMILQTGSYAQCPAAGFNYPVGTFTPTTSWQVLANDSRPGDYALFNVVSGITYEWSFCATDGGFVTWDSELTLYNNADTTTYLEYTDDACGVDAKITWTATFTGVVRLKITEFECLETLQIDATLVYRSLGIVPPPANDNCSEAINLTMNSTCVTTTGTVTGATQSQPGCALFSDANDDVWFQFVATSTAAVVSVTGSSDFDAVLEVFSGSCGALTSIACVDTSLEGDTEAVTILNLIIGNTYFVRVFDYYSSYPLTPTFDICVYSVATCNITASGAINETEPCGLDQNGGCNNEPLATPTYQPISCGDTIYGTSWSSDTIRDTDWFSFTLSGSTPVNLTANAEFPLQLMIIDVSNCASLNIFDFADGPQCNPLTINTTLPAGSYAAFISHSQFIENGCASAFTNYTLNLNYNIPATITPGGSTTFCAGDSVILSANSAQSYSWSTGDTTQTISVNATGIYTVTVTYSGGCTGSASQSVTVNTPPNTTITTSGATTFCLGDSVMLTATAGQSYLWSNGATTQSINVSASGSYTVTVTYAGGCTSSSAPAQVIVNTAPTTTISPSGPTIFCAGGNVNLTASAGTSYQWDGGSTSQTINVTSSGNYTVTVTYANGCTSSATQNINVNPNPAPSISGNTSICPGQTTTLDAGGGYTSYSWNTGSTSQTVNVADGSYTVTVTNVNGCTGSASVTVTVQTVPATNITPSGPTTFCQGGSVNLTASTGISYNWSNGATTQSVTAMASGTYTVTVVYNGGCSSTSIPTTVTVNPLPATPTITLSGSDLVSSSGTGNQWYLNGNLIPAATASTYTPTQNGNYTVQVTDANGCTAVSAPFNFTDVGINENISKNEILVYPNPVSDNFVVELEGVNESTGNILITNALGQIVKSEILIPANEMKWKFNVTYLKPGVYFVQLQFENKNYVTRIVVER